jgi:hypothetical protein
MLIPKGDFFLKAPHCVMGSLWESVHAEEEGSLHIIPAQPEYQNTNN